jgi:hypothetical protein
MVNLQANLEKVKGDFHQIIPQDVILQGCRHVGHVYRQRQCGPVETFYLFLLQILHGNIACGALRHIGGMTCSAAAYCDARMRLPLGLLRVLLHWVGQAIETLTDDAPRWIGHRVFHVDGSSFSMPDTPALQEAFGQPGCQKPGCGFPVAHLLAMFDAATGRIVDVLSAPLRTHEMSRIAVLHPRLQANDVLVADRGFCSYAHLALLSLRQIHAVFRMHQQTIVDFAPHRPYVHPGNKKVKGLPRSRWIRRVGQRDQVTEWYRPNQPPCWMSPEEFSSLPKLLHVRELEYRVETPGFRTRTIRLVTTLLNGERYPADELAQLYYRRWQVEVNLRHLKQTMGMDVLRCKTVEGVEKELLMFALVYNLVCAVICQAAQQQGVPPDRISFIDALRWLRTWKSGNELIELMVNPFRPGRVEPREIKRRPKQYKRMTDPRTVLRKRLLEKQHAA